MLVANQNVLRDRQPGWSEIPDRLDPSRDQSVGDHLGNLDGGGENGEAYLVLADEGPKRPY